MKYVKEPSKRLPVYGVYDVVVAGGGPSGVAAAISAARNGAKVLLIEQTGALGGMATNGLVPTFCPFSNFGGAVIKGIGFEIWKKLEKLGGSSGRDEQWPSIDAEKLKYLLDELTTKAGVKILFFTFLSAVMKKENKIHAVIIENKSGRQAVEARTFIDATGDGDLAFKAGVPFEKGDKSGKMQGVSLEFVVAGIDLPLYKKWQKKYYNNNPKNVLLKTAEKSGKLRSFKDSEHRMIGDVIHADSVRGYNYGHTFNIDGTNAEDLSRVMKNGRKLANEFINFAKKNIPGMKNAMLVATGSLPGVRETRRFKGAYKLTIDDFSAMKQFKDQIAIYDYPVDVHNSSKKGRDGENTMEAYKLPKGKTYGIPFASLKPLGVDNLLLTGRHISVDRLAHGSTRVMPACMAIGEAAGLAAALAAKKKQAVSRLDVTALRKRLIRQGAKV